MMSSDSLCSTLFYLHCAALNNTIKTMKSEHTTVLNIDHFTYTAVHGGLTNRLYRTHDTVYEQSFLVRMFGERSEQVVDRGREEKIITQLAHHGLACPVMHRFQGGRVEKWLQGRPLKPEEMMQTKMQTHIARKVAQMHRVRIEEMHEKPTVFETIQRWMKIAKSVRHTDNVDKAKKLAQIDLEALEREYLTYKKMLINDGIGTVVLAHNDLLSGNLLYNDEADTITLLDFEYGAMNPRGFDVANHFAECCGFECDWKRFPDFDVAQKWFRAYLAEWHGVELESITQQQINDFHHECARFYLLPHIFWATWAVVQSKFSKVDFDYLTYCNLRIEGFHIMRERVFSYFWCPASTSSSHTQKHRERFEEAGTNLSVRYAMNDGESATHMNANMRSNCLGNEEQHVSA